MTSTATSPATGAVLRRQAKAAEYRDRARAAAEAAAASELEHVRAGHVRAEQRWSELADAEDERARQALAAARADA